LAVTLRAGVVVGRVGGAYVQLGLTQRAGHLGLLLLRLGARSRDLLLLLLLPGLRMLRLLLLLLVLLLLWWLLLWKFLAWCMRAARHGAPYLTGWPVRTAHLTGWHVRTAHLTG